VRKQVPIRVKCIKQGLNGASEVEIEFDDDVKQVLMKAWGISVWDETRAQKEFASAITETVKSWGES
jgi:hypothetical protein